MAKLNYGRVQQERRVRRPIYSAPGMSAYRRPCGECGGATRSFNRLHGKPGKFTICTSCKTVTGAAR